MTEKDLSHLSDEDRAYIKELREEAKARRLEVSSLTEKLTEKEKTSTEAVTKLSDIETKLKDLQDVRTKYDTLKDEHAQAVSRSEKASLDLIRLQVALDKEIPHSFADRLKGGTKEELEADAKLLKDSLGGGKNGNRVLFDRTNTGPNDGSKTEPEFPSIARHLAEVLGDSD